MKQKHVFPLSVQQQSGLLYIMNNNPNQHLIYELIKKVRRAQSDLSKCPFNSTLVK